MNPGRSKSTWRETRPKKIANGFFALQILLFREENSRQSRSLHSHSSFLRRSFFAVRAGRADSESGYSECGPQKVRSGFSVTLANEADRFEYSGSWLAVRVFFGLTFFPPSPLFGTRAFCLCAKRTLCPLSCFSGVETPLAHRLQVCVPSPNDWLVGNRIQLQQRNCSGFTPDFSRRSTVLNSQRTKRAIAACASPFKIYLVRRVFRAHFSSASN